MEIIVVFNTIFVIVVSILAYYLIRLIAEKFLNRTTVEKHLNIIIGGICLMGFFDYYIQAFYPFGTSDTATQITILLISLIIALVSIPLLFGLQEVYPFDIAKKIRVRRSLHMVITLVIVNQILTSVVYFLEILATLDGVNILIGNNFLFTTSQAQILPEFQVSDPGYVILVVILVIKSFMVLSHHLGIILAYIGALLIFSEWGIATKDPIIGFFKTFSYGYLIQGLGQFFVSIWLIADSLGISTIFFVSTELIQYIGGNIAIAGLVVYYFSFAVASINLLSNIEHLVFPRWLIDFLKLSSLAIPCIYGLLNLILLFGSMIADFVFPEISVILEVFLEMIHLLDLFGVWLVPMAIAAFFIAGYIKSKEKPSVKFSSFLILATLSIMLIFFSGNNTLTLITWFGLSHGQFGIIGILFFMYALSRVAEHASRHRQVIKKIRENPEDFMFLAELGKSERKLRAWEKIDAMSKQGVIKPLTPIERKKDETQIAAEINSYMAEIEAIRKQRAARRIARRASTG